MNHALPDLRISYLRTRPAVVHQWSVFSVMAFGLSTPAFAQLTADAGSGPTSGAASANDAGSGPTKGAKPITDSSADMKLDGATENSAGATPGPKSTGGSQPVTSEKK
jgi:hypothetical protein